MVFWLSVASFGIPLFFGLALISRARTRKFIEDLANLCFSLAAYCAFKSQRSGARRLSRPTRSFLLDLLLPINIARDAQANLEELMPIWETEHGHRRARLIRRVQTLRIVIGHYGLPVLRLMEKLLKIVSGRGSVE